VPERLLVVDDEEGIRSSLRAILEDEGFEVDLVASGEEALDRGPAGGYDAVLLDVWLPGKDGLETLQELRDRGLDASVVMISGHGNIETAVRATKLGAFDFVEKPLSLEKVLLVLGNALRQRRLERRNRALAAQLWNDADLIGSCEAVRHLREQVNAAAPTAGRVLITGENGSGKELVARLIHRRSQRAEGPFIEMNCAAIPAELVESELFGHVRGAFTGAVDAKKGRFEIADEGTLFLDEIGDMSAAVQAKVLRILETGTLTPVGGTLTAEVDVRVIAATNRDLNREIAAGRFREDLFWRLHVIPIEVPALRQRREDIPLLASHFLERLGREYGRGTPRFDDDALEVLSRHRWPGNVRELKNLIERLVILRPREVYTASDLPQLASGGSEGFDPRSDLGDLRAARESFERYYVRRKLEELGGNVTRTARALGIERSHLYRKMRALGLRNGGDSG
jgi:two-component system nitrogen regulation response regulator NtrX